MSGPAEQQQMLVYHYINFIDNWHSIPIFPHTESLFLSGLISKQSTDYHSTACALRYNSMCLTTPQYVPYICFAVVLCVKSFIGVWHFWHSLWWHYMRDAGHMKNRGSCILCILLYVHAYYFCPLAFHCRNETNIQASFRVNDKFVVLLNWVFVWNYWKGFTWTVFPKQNFVIKECCFCFLGLKLQL